MHVHNQGPVAYSRSSQYLASLSCLWIQVASSPPDMTAAYNSRQSAVLC